mmetsp:Transcript_14356/g.34285  ORF Transcript_14356/g.34285 Transcript_14356/m.34285 type:complete len:275 (+) Transcript_14356:1383-2207(+)
MDHHLDDALDGQQHTREHVPGPARVHGHEQGVDHGAGWDEVREPPAECLRAVDHASSGEGRLEQCIAALLAVLPLDGHAVLVALLLHLSWVIGLEDGPPRLGWLAPAPEVKYSDALGVGPPYAYEAALALQLVLKPQGQALPHVSEPDDGRLAERCARLLTEKEDSSGTGLGNVRELCMCWNGEIVRQFGAGPDVLSHFIARRIARVSVQEMTESRCGLFEVLGSFDLIAPHQDGATRPPQCKQLTAIVPQHRTQRGQRSIIGCFQYGASALGG